MFDRRFRIGGEANFDELFRRAHECADAVQESIQESASSKKPFAVETLAIVVNALLGQVMDYEPLVAPLFRAASVLVTCEGYESKGLAALSLACQFAHNPKVGLSFEERQRLGSSVIEASRELLKRKTVSLQDQYLAVYAVADIAQQEQADLYSEMNAVQEYRSSLRRLPREHRLALSRHLAKKATMGSLSWASTLQDFYFEDFQDLPQQARIEALLYALKDAPTHATAFQKRYQEALIQQLKEKGLEGGRAIEIADAVKLSHEHKTDETLSRLAWHEALGAAEIIGETNSGRAKEITTFWQLINTEHGNETDHWSSSSCDGDVSCVMGLFASTLSSVPWVMQRYLALDVAFHEGVHDSVQTMAWEAYKKRVEGSPDVSDRLDGYHVAFNRARAQKDRLGGEPGPFMQEAQNLLVNTLEIMHGTLCINRLQTIIRECKKEELVLATSLQCLFVKKTDDLRPDRRIYALSAGSKTAGLGFGHSIRCAAALDRR